MSGVRTPDAISQRIEELINTLESLDDPRVRDPARELLQMVLELHGRGLARLMEIVAATGASCVPIIEAMTQDQSVSALLLLHGLHPLDLHARAARAVDRLHAPLGVHGVKIEMIDASVRAVHVRVSGRLQSTHMSAAQIGREIEAAILEAAPDTMSIEIEGLSQLDLHEVHFVRSREALIHQAVERS